MIPVILSGGSGSRLWPLSRKSFPKQFLSFHAQETLFQETVLRLGRLNLLDPIVVCNAEHRFSIASNLQDINCKSQDIILEPIARNTAPAIAVAALRALEKDKDAILLVLPADHAIEDEDVLATAFETARDLAQKDFLVTFGVKPTRAHTGYGYIKVGDHIGEGVNEISSFIEKPDEETAENLIEEGGCLWNSGMFCFKATRYLSELELYQPELLQYARQAVSASDKDTDFTRLNRNSFKKCNNISFDYAVMEKTKKGCVVAIDAQWNDIGSWDAVWEVSKKDENNNVCKGDVIIEKSTNNFIHSDGRLVVTIGIDDLMVVDTPDALLVVKKDKVQDIKDVVELLKEQGREEVLHHSQNLGEKK